MKKHFTLSAAGWTMVFFEAVMCAVWTLSVLMVDGTDSIGEDHVSLLLLFALTATSAILMKARKPHLNKTVLWMAALPLLFVSYQAMATFLLPYHPHTLEASSRQALLALAVPVR